MTLPRELAGHATDLVATSSEGEAVIDAVVLEPLVSRLVLRGDGHTTAMLRSAGHARQTMPVALGANGPATVDVYDAEGVLRQRATTTAHSGCPGAAGRVHDLDR